MANFSCSLNWKYIFLGCSSNHECNAPQPTCDPITSRCLGCMDLRCTLPGEHCDRHSGRCVNKGLIWLILFKIWWKWTVILLCNLKKNWMFLRRFLSHLSEEKKLVFFENVSKMILIQAAAVIVNALDWHPSVGMDNVWQVCYNA